MEINILGQDWTILEGTKEQHEKLINSNALCDNSVKNIILDDLSSLENDTDSQGNLNEVKTKLLRHEIIHAFLLESGLGSCSPWAENEEMVDWFARQFPKILKAFQDAKCL